MRPLEHALAMQDSMDRHIINATWFTAQMHQRKLHAVETGIATHRSVCALATLGTVEVIVVNGFARITVPTEELATPQLLSARAMQDLLELTVPESNAH